MAVEGWCSGYKLKKPEMNQCLWAASSWRFSLTFFPLTLLPTPVPTNTHERLFVEHQQWVRDSAVPSLLPWEQAQRWSAVIGSSGGGGRAEIAEEDTPRVGWWSGRWEWLMMAPVGKAWSHCLNLSVPFRPPRTGHHLLAWTTATVS